MTYRAITRKPLMFPSGFCIACGEDDTYQNGECSNCSYVGG